MSNTPESADLRKRFERDDTEALLRVVRATGDYRPGAVELARQVLATRDVQRIPSAKWGAVEVKAVEPEGRPARFD